MYDVIIISARSHWRSGGRWASACDIEICCVSMVRSTRVTLSPVPGEYTEQVLSDRLGLSAQWPR
jgi:hypothetical protein